MQETDRQAKFQEIKTIIKECMIPEPNYLNSDEFAWEVVDSTIASKSLKDFIEACLIVTNDRASILNKLDIFSRREGEDTYYTKLIKGVR